MPGSSAAKSAGRCRVAVVNPAPVSAASAAVRPVEVEVHPAPDRQPQARREHPVGGRDVVVEVQVGEVEAVRQVPGRGRDPRPQAPYVRGGEVVEQSLGHDRHAAARVQAGEQLVELGPEDVGGDRPVTGGVDAGAFQRAALARGHVRQVDLDVVDLGVGGAQPQTSGAQPGGQLDDLSDLAGGDRPLEQGVDDAVPGEQERR